jgi:4-amino-4-deoxy-L-arabinose transferase-like glycosyltransferase
MEENANNTSMSFHYRYSIGWLIFWTVIFFPVAITLLMTGITFSKDGKTHSVSYNGSRFWLCFWMVLFFPVAFILLLVNGMSLTTVDNNIIMPLDKGNFESIDGDPHS